MSRIFYKEKNMPKDHIFLKPIVATSKDLLLGIKFSMSKNIYQ